MATDFSPRTPAATVARNSLVFRLIAVAMLLVFFFLAVNSLIDDSPTIDEQNHIARGLAFLRTGDPRLSLEHPPLINVLSALPLLSMPELRLPTDHSSWERREGWYEFADLFLWEYNDHSVERIVFLARMPIVGLLIALALTGFVFARLMWGKLSALVALAFFLIEPNLLAHGRYTTTDLGGVLCTFLATFLLWRMWRAGKPWPWGRLVGAGLAMGFAFGSKLSALGFLPIWLLLAVLPLYPTPDSGDGGPQPTWLSNSLRRIIQVTITAALALFVAWAIFGFQWGPYGGGVSSPRLTGITGPAPTYVAGVGQILDLTGGESRPSYLLGQFSDSGFLSYFPVAFAVKTPLVLLVLIGLAAVLLLWNRPTRKSAAFLLVTAVAFYGLTMFSALNIGYRHALPALPYLLVLASGLATRQWDLSAKRLPDQSAKLWPRIAVGGAVVLLATTLWIHPHYLSYFNLLAGGPKNGSSVLVDSNIDWGQDLIRLKSWMSVNDVEAVNLAWFGTADPTYYGIDYNPLPGLGRDEFFRRWWDVPFDREAPEPGVYAISVSNLAELPLREEEKTVFAWFRNRQPDDRVGYSILIYDLR